MVIKNAMKTSDTFGKRLADLRQERGRTRRDVMIALHKLGCSVTEPTLNNWEKGRTSPNIQQVKNLAIVFEVEIGYFFA